LCWWDFDCSNWVGYPAPRCGKSFPIWGL